MNSSKIVANIKRSKGNGKSYSEIVILSGKGGTGKTTVAGAFTSLAGKCVVADCDVDGADLHLIMKPRLLSRRDFHSGREAVLKAGECTGCGRCVEVCRFGAVSMIDGIVAVDGSLCEGCGVCVRACPVQALDFPSRHCGEVFISETPFGIMCHARLNPGGENSGKLVTEVRKEAAEAAVSSGVPILIIDGPPGVGCQVIASVTGTDAVLAVTEPTLSGAHDLERLARLARSFGIPFQVCVNRWDINPELTLEIERKVRSWGGVPVGRIPFDTSVVRAQLAGRSVADASGPASDAIRSLWRTFGPMVRRF